MESSQHPCSSKRCPVIHSKVLLRKSDVDRLKVLLSSRSNSSLIDLADELLQDQRLRWQADGLCPDTFSMDPHLNRQKKAQAEQPWRGEGREKDDRLVVKIGGQVFETSRQTLCMDANSMLAAWVLRHLSHESAPLWIDRDEQRFRHVLNYLRNGTIWLHDVASLRAVQEEADFYGLAGLHALCEEKIQNIEAKEEADWRRRLHDLKLAIKEVLVTMDKISAPGSGDKASKFTLLRQGHHIEDPVFRMDADF